jgi:hypothetical protein
MRPPVRSPAEGPSVPAPLSFDEAMRRSAPLAHLASMLAASQARLDVVRPLLPAPLARAISAGPVDAESGSWVLLASSPPVAAKLRHWQPRLEAALKEAGLLPAVIRIKVQAG